MHPYYAENKKKFRKEMNGFLHLIQKELEDAAGIPYARLLEEIWTCYEEQFLEHFPFIGGDKSSGTRNLTGAFQFVAMGEVCRKSYGMTLEQWGYLTTLCYQRYFEKIPPFVAKLMGKLLQNTGLVTRLLRRKDEKNAANAARNPGSFVTRVQPPMKDYPVIYNTEVCPLCNFARDMGYMEYMPYICNLDYVMFGAMGVPFYREKTCAAGDGCCDFKLKPGAPIQPSWPCHSLTPGDPLK